MNCITRAVLAVAIGSVLSPLALTAPAQASTTQDGCTVTPEIPVFEGEFTSTAVPYVVYRINVTCPTGVTVETEQYRMESDTLAVEGEALDDETGFSAHD